MCLPRVMVNQLSSPAGSWLKDNGMHILKLDLAMLFNSQQMYTCISPLKMKAEIGTTKHRACRQDDIWETREVPASSVRRLPEAPEAAGMSWFQWFQVVNGTMTYHDVGVPLGTSSILDWDVP